MLEEYFKKICKRDQIIILVVLCILGMAISDIPLGYLTHKISLIPYFLLKPKINKEIQKIKDSGSPYLVEQIIPPPVPANENAAPYYNSAIELHNSCNDTDPNIKLSINDYCDFQAAFNFAQKEPQKIIAYLNKYQGVFDLLYKAYDKPKCRFDLEYEKVWGSKVPNYVSIRKMALQIVLFDAYLIQNKRYQDAVNLTARGLRLAHCVNTRPFSSLISHMIEIACYQILYEPLNYMAESNIAADYTPVLNEINTLLQSQQTAMVKTMEMERVACLDTYEKIFKGYRFKEDNSYELVPSKYNVVRPIGGYALRYDELQYLKYMGKLISRLKEGNLENFSIEEPKWNFMIMSAIFIPDVNRAVKQDCKTTADYTRLKSKLEQLNKK